MRMKRFGILAALIVMFFGFVTKASAQLLPDVPDMKGRVTMGGDFDFGIYGNYMNLALAPQVGYRIFSPWEVGIRGVYNLKCYFSYNEYDHYFGVAPYTNFQVYKGLFVHAEDEFLYGLARNNHESYNGQWYKHIFVGGGYRSYSYTGSYYYFMVLYNLSWDYGKSLNEWLYPYVSPIVLRVGICF